MKKITTEKLPNTIPVFPLSNFIIFPEITIPLNIFEPRYINMVDDCMKKSRIIGMIQPKEKLGTTNPSLYEVGCAGKITSFTETEDGRYLIVLNGISRFKTVKEIENGKLYREFNVNFDEYQNDTIEKKEDIKFSDVEPIFKNFKNLFKKNGYMIDWKEFEKQSLDYTINTLSIASPFSLEEKQALLETKSLDKRKSKLQEILNTYMLDSFRNTTIQ